MTPLKLFFALPSYDGARYNLGAILHALQRSGPFAVRPVEKVSSLLTANFNELWAEALNARAEGATHFLMLHADVVPLSPTWLAELAAIMDRTRASALSVVLPIKDSRGLMSTALDVSVPTSELPRQRRLTVEELERDFPPTFTAPTLLLNTGLLLVDLREPWVERVCFRVRDAIGQDAAGRWFAGSESEDWYFSRKARALGARLWATREVAALHRGAYGFPNTGGCQAQWAGAAEVQAKEHALEHTAEMDALYEQAREAAREG